jgi:hypothetical protein
MAGRDALVPADAGGAGSTDRRPVGGRRVRPVRVVALRLYERVPVGPKE